MQTNFLNDKNVQNLFNGIPDIDDEHYDKLCQLLESLRIENIELKKEIARLKWMATSQD